jgi:hypothetical protein
MVCAVNVRSTTAAPDSSVLAGATSATPHLVSGRAGGRKTAHHDQDRDALKDGAYSLCRGLPQPGPQGGARSTVGPGFDDPQARALQHLG